MAPFLAAYTQHVRVTDRRRSRQLIDVRRWILCQSRGRHSIRRFCEDFYPSSSFPRRFGSFSRSSALLHDPPIWPPHRAPRCQNSATAIDYRVQTPSETSILIGFLLISVTNQPTRKTATSEFTTGRQHAENSFHQHADL